MKMKTRIGLTLIALAVLSLGALSGLQASGLTSNPHGPVSSASLADLSVLGSETSMGSAPPVFSPKVVKVHFKAARSNVAGPCANAPDYNGWLTTSGSWIVDDNGCQVRLEGVTWYGMQTEYYVPAGLDFLSLDQIMTEVKQLGFNSIRIPLSDYLVKKNTAIKVSTYLKADPSLQGLHPLQILDRIVAEAKFLHLFIILDNHVSWPVEKSQIHTERKTSDPVWYAHQFPQKTWINDWFELAKRYKKDPIVTGFDLRNEPHTSGPAPHGWKLENYLTQGSTWGPYPNGKTPNRLWKSNTDWPAAATICANDILNFNPHLLMFVEGVQLYPQTNKQHPQQVDSYWWGSILKGVKTDPITLANSAYEQQLVYSPHEWGPWKNLAPQFYRGKVSYTSLRNLFNSQWGFILHMKDPHPIWLGEFNTCNLKPSCAYNSRKKTQGWWFQVLMRYLRNNSEISWSYYPLNGTNSADQPSNNSILRADWVKTDQAIMRALRPIQKQPNRCVGGVVTCAT